MKLDRGLIKQQARTLIKDKVMKLFITSFIVTICFAVVVGGLYVAAVDSVSDTFDDLYDSFGELYDYGDIYNYDDGDYDYYDDFDGNVSGYGSDFYGFDAKVPVIKSAYNPLSAALSTSLLILTYAALFLLAPLEVALAAFYVSFVRGKEYEFGAGIKSVFQNAFKVKYTKKMAVVVIKMVLMWLLSMFFYIPGIIFNYSSYFAYQIMCDYPELSPWQAIKLSKKIVEGNRTELFILDLSFIPWIFLCVFLFPAIYVIPYMQTTTALYYENFRLRAIQTGKVTEDDFLSDAQKMAKYSNPANGNPFANGNQPQGNDYSAPQQNNPYAGGAAQPVQSQSYGAQQPSYYTPAAQQPVQQPAYYNPVIPQPQNPEKPADIYTPLTTDTVNPPAEEPVVQEAPQITITEPEEPQTPVFSVPEEPTAPTADFVEPTEPEEPAEPKPITDDGSSVDI